MIKGLFTFNNIKMAISIATKVANAISLVGGVVQLGFSAKEAFDNHQKNKEVMADIVDDSGSDVQNVEAEESSENNDISENTNGMDE